MVKMNIGRKSLEPRLKSSKHFNKSLDGLLSKDKFDQILKVWNEEESKRNVVEALLKTFFYY